MYKFSCPFSRCFRSTHESQLKQTRFQNMDATFPKNISQNIFQWLFTISLVRLLLIYLSFLVCYYLISFFITKSSSQCASNVPLLDLKLKSKVTNKSQRFFFVKPAAPPSSRSFPPSPLPSSTSQGPPYTCSPCGGASPPQTRRSQT